MFYDLTQSPGYDPYNWNRWPDITPPRGYVMRIQDCSLGSSGLINRIFQCLVGFWDGSKWVDIDEHEEITIYGNNLLFRPWDERLNWHVIDD